MTAKPVRHASQSTLFLLELIIATAFLALSSVVCIRLYLYAHVLSGSSALKTQATLQLQNLASSWLSSDGTLSSALSLYEESAEEAVETAGSSTGAASSLSSSEEAKLYYNKSGELLSSPENAAFCILLSLQKEDPNGITCLSLRALPVKDGQVSSDSSASYGDLTVERYDAATTARFDAAAAVHPNTVEAGHFHAAAAVHPDATETGHFHAAEAPVRKEARL